MHVLRHKICVCTLSIFLWVLVAVLSLLPPQAYITIAEMEDIFNKVEELDPEDGANRIHVGVPACVSIYMYVCI